MDKNKTYKFLCMDGRTREGRVERDPEETACKLTEWSGVPWKVVGPFGNTKVRRV